MTTERPVSPRQGGDARGAQSDPPPSYGSLSSRVDDGTSHDVGIADAIGMGGMVERSLQKRFPRLSSDDVHDAVIDALLAVTCRPGRNGEWAALEWRYVYRAAFCNASNMAASAKARERREQRWWAQLKDQAGSSDEGDRQATLETACQKISDALPDGRMRTVFRLWASGERAATTFCRCHRSGSIVGSRPARRDNTGEGPAEEVSSTKPSNRGDRLQRATRPRCVRLTPESNVAGRARCRIPGRDSECICVA